AASSLTLQQCLFKWVSASVASGSSSAGVTTDSDTLPPPPPEIQLVL
ncbi:tellurium resistance protein TerY, partial [Klebsiella pneumoniae]